MLLSLLLFCSDIQRVNAGTLNQSKSVCTEFLWVHHLLTFFIIKRISTERWANTANKFRQFYAQVSAIGIHSLYTDKRETLEDIIVSHFNSRVLWHYFLMTLMRWSNVTYYQTKTFIPPTCQSSVLMKRVCLGKVWNASMISTSISFSQIIYIESLEFPIPYHQNPNAYFGHHMHTPESHHCPRDTVHILQT